MLKGVLTQFQSIKYFCCADVGLARPETNCETASAPC